MKKYLLLLIAVAFSFYGFSQETFPVNGVKDNRANAVAITNATIHVNATNVVQNGTMLIRNGKIEAVGAGIAIPAGYTAINMNGTHVYPSFIDLYSSYGIPRPERRGRGGFGGAEQIQSETKGAYNGNEAIKSEYNAYSEFTKDEKEGAALIKNGFGAVLSQRMDGLARGTSTFVTLGKGSDNEVTLNEKAANHFSFDKGSSRQSYPGSAMGYIALLRQTYEDAKWYDAQSPKPFKDMSLDAWNANRNLPQIFDASGWLTALRADKVGDEFGVQYVIKGGGDEYQRMAEVKKMNASMIIPVNFPAAYDVDDPWDAQRVSLSDMKHWELAPANLSYLEKNGINFTITSFNNSNFLENLRKSVEYGLSKEAALNALTVNPAKLIKMDGRIGTLEKGKVANFIVTSGDVFDADTKMYENWIQGDKNIISDRNTPDYAGKYDLNVEGKSYALTVSGDPGSHSAEIAVNDSTKTAVTLKIEGQVVNVNFKPEGADFTYRLSGWINSDGFKGQGLNAKGSWISWTASKTANVQRDNKKKGNESKETPSLGDIIYPFTAYGSKELPKQQTILIKNATVWTNESDGVLQNTDVLLKDGKIAKIGKNLSDKADRVIDATGKHVTAGVIDEHSHLGASAINDVATNSSMVRIGDVVTSEDVGVYRALAGGVTALQILHGSANPIGGQSALIKLRWGQAPEEMKIAGADGYIKFALGENVKRSRSTNSIRYPLTRMGVEQVYVDAFTNGREYEKEWKAYNALSSKEKAKTTAPRKDLVNETMVEILNGKRFISCHSYVQSEINMLMKVAEQFGFKINTFTHILEGYKVADIMAEHGVGASTFSDWWNYKWEVRYAIPYNAALMHRAGVVTAVNSDSEETIRRLNQEAGKIVKYGGVTEEEALKMVTLNPATLLHLNNRMGSIKVGKDADVVVWTENPLSVYTKADKTIVDGIVYFDLEKDLEHRAYIDQERARLIEKMKGVKKSGGRFARRGSAEQVEFHCEDVLGEESDLAKY